MVRTVEWDSDLNALKMIDQRRLPGEYSIVTLESPEAVAEAIRQMIVRGAPAIGASAAFGLALAAARSRARDLAQLWQDLEAAAGRLRAARPTAVNLNWAIERMLDRARASPNQNPDGLRRALLAEAQQIADQDVATNRRMGEHGASLIQDGDTLIHHCNTGALATVDYGTALGAVRTAHEHGKRVHVLVDETRPRLQGARLTAWELDQYGIDHEIISDGAAGSFLQSGAVASVFVGADRIAANGDVANKIGTYMLALAANDNRIPFYVVAPTSTVDLGLASGDLIPIEERPEEEVLDLQAGGEPIAPAGSQARNPAFDITPHRLISAIVTEVGILRPPYQPALTEAVHAARGQWTSS
jgi:methylthioribose-1-phosphate isomerase